MRLRECRFPISCKYVIFHSNLSEADLAQSTAATLQKAKSPNIVYLGPASLLRGLLADLEDRISLTWIVVAASEAEAKTVERELSYEASIYFVVRDYLDAPEFTHHYRGLSSHSSKTAEDLRVMSVIGAVAQMLSSAAESNCSSGSTIERNGGPMSDAQGSVQQSLPRFSIVI